jgi:hypothetical protein
MTYRQLQPASSAQHREPGHRSKPMSHRSLVALVMAYIGLPADGSPLICSDSFADYPPQRKSPTAFTVSYSFIKMPSLRWANHGPPGVTPTATAYVIPRCAPCLLLSARPMGEGWTWDRRNSVESLSMAHPSFTLSKSRWPPAPIRAPLTRTFPKSNSRGEVRDLTMGRRSSRRGKSWRPTSGV